MVFVDDSCADLISKVPRSMLRGDDPGVFNLPVRQWVSEPFSGRIGREEFEDLARSTRVVRRRYLPEKGKLFDRALASSVSLGASSWKSGASGTSLGMMRQLGVVPESGQSEQASPT